MGPPFGIDNEYRKSNEYKYLYLNLNKLFAKIIIIIVVRTVAWLKGRVGLLLARTAVPLTVRATTSSCPSPGLPVPCARLSPFL